MSVFLCHVDGILQADPLSSPSPLLHAMSPIGASELLEATFTYDNYDTNILQQSYPPSYVACAKASTTRFRTPPIILTRPASLPIIITLHTDAPH